MSIPVSAHYHEMKRHLMHIPCKKDPFEMLHTRPLTRIFMSNVVSFILSSSTDPGSELDMFI